MRGLLWWIASYGFTRPRLLSDFVGQTKVHSESSTPESRECGRVLTDDAQGRSQPGNQVRWWERGSSWQEKLAVGLTVSNQVKRPGTNTVTNSETCVGRPTAEDLENVADTLEERYG